MLRQTHLRHICCCLLLYICFTPKLAAKTIVLINSYHTGYEWSDLCLQGFSDVIEPGNAIISYEMDTKRNSADHFEQISNSIWEKVVKAHPDIVVTMDDNALKFFGQRVVSELGVPIVFMGVNDNPRAYFINKRIPSLVSGVMERPLVEQNITFLSQLLPLKNKRILLMMDNSVTTNSFIETVFTSHRNLLVDEVNLEVFTVSSLKEWQQKIKSLSADNYDALIIGSFGSLRDNQNRQVPLETISLWTSKHSKLPIFSFWENETGKGKAIGGLVMAGYEHGRTTAEIVNEILSSRTIPPIKLPKKGKFIFSQSELERWNIQLPENIKKRSELVE